MKLVQTVWVELVAQDIIVISNDFDMYYHRVRKYRAIINVIDEKIFEYDPVSGMITIYLRYLREPVLRNGKKRVSLRAL